MVWSQYVYEATAGSDTVYVSDDDDYYDNTPLNIEEWEVQYSDELHMMWNKIDTLLYDAQIEHTGEFCDFVEFCYKDHDPIQERVFWDYQEQTNWYEERVAYIWKHVRRTVSDNGLHEEMMKDATFNDFLYFVKNYMCIY
jgi:hypothetical protein|tara:strand:- start:909 stop:1328 length:420 start_codon:yes stop_codon:yes gene_type:complete